jgi:hypothetical protein
MTYKICCKKKAKLIIITGSPCVGKTAVAESLFESYENCAYFDGDWAWCVNPFSLDDSRLRNGDKTMSFAMSAHYKLWADSKYTPNGVNYLLTKKFYRATITPSTIYIDGDGRILCRTKLKN